MDTEENKRTIAPETVNQGTISPAKKRRMRRKKAQQRAANKSGRVYEITQDGETAGIAPVQPFLPDWDEKAVALGAAPSAKQTVNPNKRKRRRKSKSARQLIWNIGELKQRILSELEDRKTTMSAGELSECLKASFAQVETSISELSQNGSIVMSRRKRYGLPEHMGYVKGKVQVTSRGYAFILCGTGSDLFVRQECLNGALNGDTVTARESGFSSGNREGEIISIDERANSTVVGIIHKLRTKAFIQPDDSRLNASFSVPKGCTKTAEDGDKVVCELVYGDGEPIAKVIEVLGKPTGVGTDILSIIRANELPDRFPPAVKRCEKTLPTEVTEADIAGREDLRKLITFTIDGADAKDFDDAVSLQITDNGNYLLSVHIADVSYYVKEGGAIDKEAVRRGTSAYFPDRVLPMLPETLSNGICSLQEGVDRLTLSCFMEFDKTGEQLNHRICQSVIRSRRRLIYENVNLLLSGDKAIRREFRGIIGVLESMKKLAALLRAKRMARGSLDFDLPESDIHLDENGLAVDVSLHERGESNLMIEDFMLACNETVANQAMNEQLPIMFRVHENPSQEKLDNFNKFLGTIGMKLRTDSENIRPKHFKNLLDSIKGTPQETAVSKLLLRSLAKARYCEDNLGHFGLAAEYYCHFTSPIRRYPDLITHRVLKEAMSGKLTRKRLDALQALMPKLAVQCSDCERRAMEAERSVDDMKKCEYLSAHLGEKFDGIISGINAHGFFVALPNTCEGFVPSQSIGDDTYFLNEAAYSLIGRRNRRIFRLGDSVRIRIDSVDPLNPSRINFELLRSDSVRRRKRRR